MIGRVYRYVYKTHTYFREEFIGRGVYYCCCVIFLTYGWLVMIVIGVNDCTCVCCTFVEEGVGGRGVVILQRTAGDEGADGHGNIGLFSIRWE